MSPLPPESPSQHRHLTHPHFRRCCCQYGSEKGSRPQASRPALCTPLASEETLWTVTRHLILSLGAITVEMSEFYLVISKVLSSPDKLSLSSPLWFLTITNVIIFTAITVSYKINRCLFWVQMQLKETASYVLCLSGRTWLAMDRTWYSGRNRRIKSVV